jgi:cytochrome c
MNLPRKERNMSSSVRVRMALVATALAAVAYGGVVLAQTGPAPDPKRGAEVFRVQCSVCHSVEAGKSSIGPSLYGVVGRKAGSLEGFKYSDAMKKVDATWTPETLDRYLENPWLVAPGTPMALVVPSVKNRTDVIAYLKSVAPPPAQ